MSKEAGYKTDQDLVIDAIEKRSKSWAQSQVRRHTWTWSQWQVGRQGKTWTQLEAGEKKK